MTYPTPAQRWQDAMRRARGLNPRRIASAINLHADTGLRASQTDKQGGRTTFVPCEDPERCDEGPDDHSHMVAADPTGNAAVNGRRNDANGELLRLDRAVVAMVSNAAVVLDFVKGQRPATWSGVTTLASQLMPGTVQAGLDVDDDYRLPPAIRAVEDAVSIVHSLARDHLPRDPTEDERNWMAGLSDNDVCAWHLEVEPKGHYRRPRAGGTNCCQECLQVAEWIGRKPPDWFMDAMVDRDAKPKAYDRALSRMADELDMPAHRRVG